MAHGKHYNDQQQYSGDEAKNVKQASNHMPAEDRVHETSTQLQTQYAQQQAAQLHGDVQIDDRAVVDPPNWAAKSSTALYNAATQQNDPSMADELGRAFTQNGNDLATAANELNEALTALDANWEGRAASTAQGSIQPLADHAGLMGQSAQLMGTSLSQQSVAASEVQRLPMPVEFDASAAALHNKDVDANGGTPIDINAETQKANAAKAEQVRYLTEYTKAMDAADKQMPVFVKPPETISGKNGGKTSGVGGAHVQSMPRANVHNPSQGTSTGVPTSNAPGASGASDPNDPNNNNQIPTVGTPIAGTSASGYTGGSPITTSPGIGSGPVNVGQPSAPGAGQGGFGGGFGNFSGSTTGGGPGADGAGSGDAAGGRGGAGVDGRGGAGARGGMGTGPMEEAFGRGGAGGPGGRGGMGAGGHGAKGENGEEDEEHERPSYLLEPDPDAVFDTDQLTAPPVIGGE